MIRRPASGLTGERIAAAFAEAEAEASSRIRVETSCPCSRWPQKLAPDAGQSYRVFHGRFRPRHRGSGGRAGPAGRRSQSGRRRSARDRLPDLDGAEINLVFPAAAGIQQPLERRDLAWRETYWEDLAAAVQCATGRRHRIECSRLTRSRRAKRARDPEYRGSRPFPPPCPSRTQHRRASRNRAAAATDSCWLAAASSPIRQSSLTKPRRPHNSSHWPTRGWTYPGSYSASPASVEPPTSAPRRVRSRYPSNALTPPKALLIGLGVGKVTAEGRGIQRPARPRRRRPTQRVLPTHSPEHRNGMTSP